VETDCISTYTGYPSRRIKSHPTRPFPPKIPALRRYLGPKSVLTVVIYHHGTSATGGHYTADVLPQDGLTWLNLDDTKLKWVDSSHVAVTDPEDDHQNGEDIDLPEWNKSKVAYILLYKRAHV
jgi:ubiquitin carboxyl-terminal hydrolase 10